MAITRPFAYNLGSNIPGTIQLGNLAVGVDNLDYSEQPGGVRWWNGPDESLGYVIAHETISGNQPNPVGVDAYLGFWRSEIKTESSFIQLAEWVSAYNNNPQTFSNGNDAKIWLNDNGFWTSYSPNTPFNDLEIIAQYLRNYMPEFRNPDFYDYQLDGNGYYISDGGDDMYDGGNVSTPWLISNEEYISSQSYDSENYPYAVDYTNSATTVMTDSSFGYISLGYEQYNNVSQSSTYLPLTILGARDNSTYGSGLPIGFQTGGNSGADGGGSLSSGTIYSGETVSGFTVHAFYRETYDAGDPSHCDVYILLGHPNWDSVFGPTVSSFAQPTDDGGCGGYLYTTGTGTQNILSIKTLLSKQNGVEVTQSECQTVVNNFIARISEAVGFGPQPTTTTTTTAAPTTTTTTTAAPTTTTTTTTIPVSGFTINIYESGSDVVMTASGSLNINDLTFVNNSNLGGGGIGINTATFIMGGLGSFDTYSGITTFPSSFGSGSGAGSTSSSGDIIGVIIDMIPPYFLAVPSGYTSGSQIYSIQTFNNQSFSSLGLVPGTYTYTWGSGANTDAINVIIGVAPVTTTTTTSSGGTGQWEFYYSTEGDLTAGPPTSSGNTIFLYQNSPTQQTFGPNYTGGTFSLLFNVNDSNGNNYLSQFLELDNNGGTITITQNGNSASYSGLGLDYYMGPSDQWVELRVLNNSQVIQQSAQPFVYGVPITLTIS